MSYKFDSFVKNTEANALKEMIFNRVRERTQAIGEDVQSDVMDMARNSFVSNNNPFSQIMAHKSAQTDSFENTVKAVKEDVKTEQNKETQENTVGFPKRELKARAIEQDRMVQAQLTSGAIMNTMDDAREGLSNKTSFMGALNFLNSQAAVSLMRTRADRFEVLT